MTKKINKTQCLANICYTDLVYSRINKKLGLNLNRKQIEKLIFKIISETPESSFKQTGKNIYVISSKAQVSVTINSYTNRVITVDKFKR